MFAAWQANGLRAIDSWKAEALFSTPGIPLAYADGPSRFVDGGPDVLTADLSAYPLVDVVVPLPDPARPLTPETLAATRTQWAQWGCPPETWLRFLSAAPHVFWGWSEFHRLGLLEGTLPRRTQALTIALLATMIDHEEWIAGMLGGGAECAVSAAELSDLRNGRFSGFDPVSEAALTYAQRLERDYATIDDSFFAAVAAPLAPGQLVELGNLIGMHMGCIRLARYLARHQLGQW